MKLFLITTNGMCTNGTAIVLDESEEHAKKMFNDSIEDEWKGAYEHKIIKIKEIDINTAQVVTYDDGDR